MSTLQRFRVPLLGLSLITTSLASWLVITGSVLAFAARGHAAWLDGLFNAVIWVATMVAAIFVGPLTKHLSVARLLLAACGLRLLGAWLFLASDHAGVWVLGSLSNGLATGVLWVLLESLLAELVPPEKRGRLIGLIETFVGATGLLAGAVATLFSDRLEVIFWLAMGLVLVTVACCILAGIESLGTSPPAGGGASGAFGWRPFLPVLLLAAVGGAMESGSTGVLPVIALQLGLTASVAAATVTLIGAGSLLGQFPLGALSDRLGVVPVASGTLGVLLFATPFLALAGGESGALPQWVLWGIGFVWGLAGGGLYTLTIVAVGHSYTGAPLVRAMGLLVVVYTLGAAVGPIAATALFSAGGLAMTALVMTCGLAVAGSAYLALSARTRPPRGVTLPGPQSQGGSR